MKTVFIFISFLLLVACSNKNAELAKKHNDEGVLFLDKEEYDKASESFHTALGQGKINVELEAGILRNIFVTFFSRPQRFCNDLCREGNE
jgi:hypothetical protein